MLRLNHIVCGLAVGGFMTAASADVVFNLSYEISGASPPASGTPWMTVRFANVDDKNIKVTVSNLGLTGTEFVSGLYFNITVLGEGAPTSMGLDEFSAGSGEGFAGFDGKTFNPEKDAAFKADGDGYFDFRIDWGNGDFVASEIAVFNIKRASGGMSDALFDALSEPGGGSGQHHVAAHVQGIGPSGANSGWIADNPPPIPLPTAAGMAFMGMLGLGSVRRRRSL